MSDKAKRYGRGTHDTHPKYIEYMKMIVNHPNYKDMPNAVTEGRINWQVSSGKTTSFYKYYLQRFDWWVMKADALKVPGTGNSSDRFSITSRLIHPTGYRTCRLCGEDKNVGYFYTNKVFARRLSNQFPGADISEKTPMNEVLELLINIPKENVLEFFIKIFPERKSVFEQLGVTTAAFENTTSLRSFYLSPGFMCNPPDRLDGFHDYCLDCRENKDPGRSKENMRSYSHDRRVFELWSEGDWVVADALYNSAGSGICDICDKELKKVSPDHVGPLSCGFKQLPLFRPMCPSCNSSKNRRLRIDDVKILLAYEIEHKESVASWQVRPLWDAYKNNIKNDSEAKELSDYMRSLQDYFLRFLYEIYELGYSEFLRTLIHPEYALFDVEFINLDSSTFKFDRFEKNAVNTILRNRLTNRVVRIAFEELVLYNQKDMSDRKVRKYFLENFSDLKNDFIKKLEDFPLDEKAKDWDKLMKSTRTSDLKDRKIELLGGKPDVKKYQDLLNKLEIIFLQIGKQTDISFHSDS